MSSLNFFYMTQPEHTYHSHNCPADSLQMFNDEIPVSSSLSSVISYGGAS